MGQGPMLDGLGIIPRTTYIVERSVCLFIFVTRKKKIPTVSLDGFLFMLWTLLGSRRDTYCVGI